MGKYRTFSSTCVRLLWWDPLQLLWYHGDGLCRFAWKHESPRILPLRGKIPWAKWSTLGIPSLVNLLVIGGLLLLHPCSSFPLDNREINLVNAAEIQSSLRVEQTHASLHDNRIKLSLDPVESGLSHTGFITSQNCTRPSSEEFPADLFSKEQRQNGAIAIHFIVLLYMLYALFLVCDEYFVPAVECICEDLRIPHNIAGSTLMAISTSAPELFTNVIGTFVTKGDLGVGTIVGSAVFNILAVGTCIGIGTNFVVQGLPVGPSYKRVKRKGVPLEWWSLTRDSALYLASVVALIIVLFDGRVYWYEALIMLVIYGLYIVGMCYDTQCKEWFEALGYKIKRAFTSDDDSPRRLSALISKIMDETEDENATLISKDAPERHYGSRSSLDDKKDRNGISASFSSNQSLQLNKSTKASRKVSMVEVIAAYAEPLDTSSSSTESGSSQDSTISTIMVLEGFKDICTFPIHILLRCTIPDCRKPDKRKWCVASLISCVVWIGGLSYVISWMVCTIGETLAIPDSVSGLTFLAAGTSLPEVISSVIVARQGFGAMALSNSIGSNTFDILVCLGLPWLVQSLILSSAAANYIEIHSGGLEYSATLLISSLVLLYIIMALNGYHLDMKIGIACVVMYIIFVSIACLLEMNVFFPVNLPPC